MFESTGSLATFQSDGICIDLVLRATLLMLMLDLKETSIKLKANKKVLRTYWTVGWNTFDDFGIN